jgi:hypothetical protein
VHKIIDSMTKLLPGLVLTAFIFGAIPALAMVNTPAAMATPQWAQEPPQPPQLSDDERQALDDEKAGRPVKDPKVLSSAKTKQQTAEKYEGKRNQQKQRGAPRRRR